MWCIPPRANAEFVWRMEDVLATYKLPYDARFPMVCNLFGTPERVRFMFRGALDRVRALIAARGDPGAVLRGDRGKPPANHVEVLRWSCAHSDSMPSSSARWARWRR